MRDERRETAVFVSMERHLLMLEDARNKAEAEGFRRGLAAATEIVGHCDQCQNRSDLREEILALGEKGSR